MPKVDFREFQEIEARNECLQAESHIQRRYSEVEKLVAYHLGGRLGHITLLGMGNWENGKVLRHWTNSGILSLLG